MSETRQLHVYDFDPDLKARLVADSEERQSSVNDVAIGILAEHFGVRFVGTGRRSPGASTEAASLMLPVPETLYRKVGAAVSRQAKGRRSKARVVEDVVRDYYKALDAAHAA